MSKLHVNLMADDDLRKEIREFIKGEIRATVSEERDRMLKELLPGAVKKVITADNVLNFLIPRYSLDTPKRREQLMGIVEEAVKESATQIREARVAQINSMDASCAQVLLDTRIQELLKDNKTLEIVIKDCIRQLLAK